MRQIFDIIWILGGCLTMYFKSNTAILVQLTVAAIGLAILEDVLSAWQENKK